MKKYLLIALLLGAITALRSQQIYLEGGQVLSNFKFEDSQGNLLNNLNTTQNSFIKLGYRMNILTKNLYLNTLLTYNGYGSEGSDRTVDNYFAWDLSYLGLSVSPDYEFYRKGNFTFLANGGGSVEFLIRGAQTLNNQVYPLIGEENFDSPIGMLRAGLGVRYKISEKVDVFTQYNYGWGGPLKSNTEKLRIRAHNFGIGLLVNLSATETPSKGFENTQVNQLQDDLKETLKRINVLEKEAKRVDELETELKARDTEMKVLRDTLTTVLFDYSDKGLNVDLRENKIYITLDNDMLFRSGSWELESGGISAVNALAKVLAENPDVDILIEGHTDNQPYKGSGNIRNNWELSTKRAAAIVEILAQNEKINPSNLTAAGRGEYDPIASNATKEGRAKNRRIEVIISPQLDEVYKILKN